MICKKITYKNFRNIENAEITLDPSVTVFNGFNGQGKTNILEGIYFCSGGRSFRTVHENELVRFGQDYAKIEMEFFDGKRDNTISFRLVPKSLKRFCLLNDVPMTRLSEIVGKFRAVLFCPEHLSIVKDGPAVRRRFIDYALSQTDSEYLRSLQKYNGLLRERNALIKMAQSRRDDELFYKSEGVFSEQLATEGEKIAEKREEYVNRLNSHVKDVISDMTASKENASVCYNCRKSKEEYLELLYANRERELRFGSTMYGIHKDDLEITLNGKEARSFSSQGQLRSVALSMKIAEGEISKEIMGSYPVFLFDDILSELDIKRREYLLGGISGKQVIITSCDKIETPCKLYHVENGRVV